jgi:hypothetical protein
MNPQLDPFLELARFPLMRLLPVLGANVEFRSNSARLLALASHAFEGLPAHRWYRGNCRLSIHMRLVRRGNRPRRMPSAPKFSSVAGNLMAIVDADNFAMLDPERRSALVQVSDDMLAHAYHVRYELIEFAAITLATRAQLLLPLHAACVGWKGRGLLVLGDSGAGKSSFVLAALQHGLDLLSEDSVFVQPSDRRVTGIGSFVYVRPSGLHLISSSRLRDRVARAPLIRRRSGVRKRELDTRRMRARLARRPLEIVGTLVLSPHNGREGELLRPIPRSRHAALLRRLQPYATRHPLWREFAASLAARGAWRLLRGRDLDESIRAARALLEWPERRPA